jgi:hypothetical protein
MPAPACPAWMPCLVSDAPRVTGDACSAAAVMLSTGVMGQGMAMCIAVYIRCAKHRHALA